MFMDVKKIRTENNLGHTWKSGQKYWSKTEGFPCTVKSYNDCMRHRGNAEVCKICSVDL